MRKPIRTLKRVLFTTLFVLMLPSISSAGATSLPAVTFTAPAPTSLLANTASTWTVGFTTSTTGALGPGSTITVTFPSGFTTSSTAPAITLKTQAPFVADCSATGVDANELNVVTINLTTKTGTCALANYTAATLTVAVVNGASGTYGGSNFSVATSSDTTAVNPSGSEKITVTTLTAVTAATTSTVKDAASTWTWGFSTSATGALGPGSTITVSFTPTFSTVTTTPAVVLDSPSSFSSDCTATASDPSMSNVVVITLTSSGSNPCALGASTAASLGIAVVNGTGDAFSNMSVSTSMDANDASPTGTAITLSAATKTTAVSYTTTAPTSLVANTASTWTVKFSSSSAGSLFAGSYIVATFPSGFTTSSNNPTIVLQTPSTFPTYCTATSSDPTMTNIVIVYLANNGSNICNLAVSTATVRSFAVINGPAGTYGNTSYSLQTSMDGTTVSPTSGSETIVAAGPPGTGSNWAMTSSTSPGEAAAGLGPGVPASMQGGTTGGYMCDSNSSEQVDLSWSAVPGATSYLIEQASSSAGPFSAASPPFFSGSTATITYTTAGQEYYEVEAVAGTAWVSVPSDTATNGSISPSFLITSTSSPKCTNI